SAPLEDLSALAGKADAGRGALALVSGEAGIGKTALLAAFRERAADRYDLAWGGCEALFTPRPLGPLHDMSGAFTPRLKTLLGSPTPPSSIFHAVLDDIAQRGRTKILVFEDVHWADHATLDLLKFLGRRIPMCKALLVLSYRDDEIAADHPLNEVIG